ncbi:WD repeat-containing protein 3 [Fasciola gigantica]|uniref:WD repeat-containing protein 3 n=1 Tax=Fasciola gigantica TaxID=46835 RepID=A0A504YSR5_FASGI|nr:WD repeat-containing protein 3 [Fasciola gigantica]
MKVTKTYQDYRQDVVFGIITSEQPKINYVPASEGSTFCAVGSADSVIFWNLVTSEAAAVFKRVSGIGSVSCLCLTRGTQEKSLKLGVGYADGWVAVFDANSGESESNFRAGRSRVSAIEITEEKLVCAADSEIHVLDIVSDSGARMKGHRGIITRLKLIRNGKVLLSSAQDSFIKMWDLKNHHCFATLTGHSGPVWDFALSSDGQLLVSGAADSQLRVWRLFHSTHEECEVASAPVANLLENPTEDTIIPLSEHRSLISVEFLGVVQRNGARRVHTLGFDATGTFLVVQSFERCVEIFQLLDQEAQTKRLRKKTKKAKERGSSTEDIKLEISDILRPVLRVSLPAKVASCAVNSVFSFWKDGILCEQRLRFLCALKNNSIEELEATFPASGSLKPRTVSVTRSTVNGGTYVRLLNQISGPGHRTIPMACALTSDGLGVFTLARTEAKLWSRRSGHCLITLDWKLESPNHKKQMEDDPKDEAGDLMLTKASSFVLAPGDRHVVIGFESGHLTLFDISSKAVRQTIKDAHNGAVRGLSLTGDKVILYVHIVAHTGLSENLAFQYVGVLFLNLHSIILKRKARVAT